MLLFEDGPYRQRIEELGIAAEVLASEELKGVRRESGLSALMGVLSRLNRRGRRIAAQAPAFDAIYAKSQKALTLGCLARRKGQPLIWHLRDILTADQLQPCHAAAGGLSRQPLRDRYSGQLPGHRRRVRRGRRLCA